MKALITGITGQDGSYLSELLLSKGYEVHGIKRRSSTDNTERIKHLDVHLHDGDLADSLSVLNLIKKIQPDEIYNLAAQSHVYTSFEVPEYTSDINALGLLRILEAVRILGIDCKVYQASTSELFGKVTETPQKETTPFYPRSPYGVSKLHAYWTAINYRESYQMFVSNGILFNHESPLRGEEFVTRKITIGVAKIKMGLQDKIYLGNLDSKRDWGHAKDYVDAMWLILQHPRPNDFVIATGQTYTVREFVRKSFAAAGMDIVFVREGQAERGYVDGRCRVEVSPEFFRPCEVDLLVGDSTKAKQLLGWQPKYDIDMLIDEMIKADLCKLTQS